MSFGYPFEHPSRPSMSFPMETLHRSSNSAPRVTFVFLVGPSGLEPPTLRLSGARSSQLSYGPIFLTRTTSTREMTFDLANIRVQSSTFTLVSDAYNIHSGDDARPREHSVCCFLRLWRSYRFSALASKACKMPCVFCVCASLYALCTTFGVRALNVPVPASLGARHCLQTLSGGGHASTASRSSQTTKMLRILVEVRGFEPLTPCLQGRCSPS